MYRSWNWCPICPMEHVWNVDCGIHVDPLLGQDISVGPVGTSEWTLLF